MFGWAITFLIVALVAALFGFGGVATFAVDIARVIFFLAIGLVVISAVGGLIRGRTGRVPTRNANAAKGRLPTREP